MTHSEYSVFVEHKNGYQEYGKVSLPGLLYYEESNRMRQIDLHILTRLKLKSITE